MQWKWLFSNLGLRGWGTQVKAKKRISHNIHRLFGPQPILNCHTSFNCSNTGKQEMVEDYSEKEQEKHKINTMVRIFCHIKVLLCFLSISLKISLRGKPPNYMAKF